MAVTHKKGVQRGLYHDEIQYYTEGIPIAAYVWGRKNFKIKPPPCIVCYSWITHIPSQPIWFKIHGEKINTTIFDPPLKTNSPPGTCLWNDTCHSHNCSETTDLYRNRCPHHHPRCRVFLQVFGLRLV